MAALYAEREVDEEDEPASKVDANCGDLTRIDCIAFLMASIFTGLILASIWFLLSVAFIFAGGILLGVDGFLTVDLLSGWPEESPWPLPVWRLDILCWGVCVVLRSLKT